MSQLLKAALAGLLSIGIALGVAAPGAAATTGNETFRGVIVASGSSGDRVVVASTVIAKGIFKGVGRIVEIPNQPGDPDNVARDDLVFADGTMHLVTTTLDASFSVNPHSCVFTTTLQQAGTIADGTGRFESTTGSTTATLTTRGLLARNSDGSCSFEQTAILDVDTFTATGSLSF